ncbi:hypothetical protein BB560_003916 [Smittium megazygosporum]|uniref:Uncharacterized protein n=1 Tax=Smittium megazygosporum TaxID=133381 RepID=A0A2T9ZAR6_9FUNG|nr:hypothetical protein BB560_003916 [Smittium megazygosporum]
MKEEQLEGLPVLILGNKYESCFHPNTKENTLSPNIHQNLSENQKSDSPESILLKDKSLLNHINSESSIAQNSLPSPSTKINIFPIEDLKEMSNSVIDLIGDRDYKVFPVSGLSGDGLSVAVDWLYHRMVQRRDVCPPIQTKP